MDDWKQPIESNQRILCFFVSDLDPRVRTLGYMVKLFAKVGLIWLLSFFFNKNFQVCDIGDASRGSLSSYAYILMMIFYLQVLRMMQQFICWFSLQSDKIRITLMNWQSSSYDHHNHFAITMIKMFFLWSIFTITIVIMFLAVQNSSIGDLVPWLVPWLVRHH